MGIHDRDWYREEVRRREQGTRQGRGIPQPPEQDKRAPARPQGTAARTTIVWSTALLAAMLGLALIVHDMKQRGVPFTLSGLRWWLSLWFGAPGP